MGKLYVSGHPIISHKLSVMRDKNTSSTFFRRILSEISSLLAYEVTKDLELSDYEIETPMQKMLGKKIKQNIVIVPILRAGLGMIDGFLELIPNVSVGHIGLYRDQKTHKAVEYYCKLPSNLNESLVILVDPMLATGGSASDAIAMIKEKGALNIRFASLVSAPEGVNRVQAEHPDVDIYTCALDECLNENAYILPGLGDAGDRIFGTEK